MHGHSAASVFGNRFEEYGGIDLNDDAPERPMPFPVFDTLPIVDIGLCEGYDHILVGIGGSRLEAGTPIWARLELWATKDDIESIVDAALAGDSKGRGSCLNVDVLGEAGAKIVRELQSDTELAKFLKLRIVGTFLLFLKQPGVAGHVQAWRALRSRQGVSS